MKLNQKLSYSVLLIVFLISIGLALFCYQETKKDVLTNLSSITQLALKISKDNKVEKDNESETKLDDVKEVEIIQPKMDVKSFARYYSDRGDQLGIGPLPPQVDIQTNYWIFWEIESINSDFNNFLMSCELPENVIFTGNKTLLSGKLNHGEESRKVVWLLDSVKKNNQSYIIGFEVSLIPVKEDLGKIVNLAENIKYSVFSNKNIELKKELNNINTELSSDNLASGQGRIISSD